MFKAWDAVHGRGDVEPSTPAEWEYVKRAVYHIDDSVEVEHIVSADSTVVYVIPRFSLREE